MEFKMSGILYGALGNPVTAKTFNLEDTEGVPFEISTKGREIFLKYNNGQKDVVVSVSTVSPSNAQKSVSRIKEMMGMKKGLGWTIEELIELGNFR